MKQFIKLYPLHFQQIIRNLETQAHVSAMPILISEITRIMDQKNHVKCSRKDVMRWLSHESDKVASRLMPKLERIGFWVSVKRKGKKVRGLYMINPSVLNNVQSKLNGMLSAIYLNYGGKRIEFDSYMETLGEKDMDDQNYIELEINKDYELQALERLQEVDKMRNMVDWLKEQVDRKDAQISEKDTQIRMIFECLTPEQIKKVERHLKIIKGGSGD